jgi:hypothetical protein
VEQGGYARFAAAFLAGPEGGAGSSDAAAAPRV